MKGYEGILLILAQALTRNTKPYALAASHGVQMQLCKDLDHCTLMRASARAMFFGCSGDSGGQRQHKPLVGSPRLKLYK